MAITIDGLVQSLYSTLAVRLGHSGLFTTRRAEMLRNAAVFTARAGGKCRLFVHEFARAGRLILFFRMNIPALRRGSTSSSSSPRQAPRAGWDGELVRFFVSRLRRPVRTATEAAAGEELS